ncbi:hypothetical protein F2P81_004847 [Scophthalmus maximus]|uniref:Uncharacterized protein n=1 Tax=Scophthalmus maximus TaxID=52904 RepID=A0A6A4TIH9_SCOMX|nr:hypothetical protein F2P81_004847 [Scophthalmus maximus]
MFSHSVGLIHVVSQCSKLDSECQAVMSYYRWLDGAGQMNARFVTVDTMLNTHTPVKVAEGRVRQLQLSRNTTQRYGVESSTIIINGP